MAIISVKNVGKAFRQYSSRWRRLCEWGCLGYKNFHHLKWVLKDITFEVQQGESVGIIGINGAGKSTLLKLITGTTLATTGDIKLNGRVAALLELGMGFHPDFTGRENVYMAGQLLGLTTSEISKVMNDIEDFAEIGEYIDQPVRIYSSGMQVRLAFSVATAVRPDILIIDEALSVGDARFQAKCYKRINDFKNKGTTLLLVSHSPSDIVKHCQRAILLKNGHIEIDGPSREVTNIYLDEIFGRRDKKEVKNNVALLKSEKNIFLHKNIINEEFEKRPGYRKEEHRWGDGGAAILDYLILSEGKEYPSRIESNSETEFCFTVKFFQNFESVVPGFLIKTIEGIFLYGTNSLLSSHCDERIQVREGDIKVFKFAFPMSLNEGNYLISFGISSGEVQNSLVPLDRRYDSVLVYVGRQSVFWGITDFNASFSQTNYIFQKRHD